MNMESGEEESSMSPLLPTRCIYKVPDHFRKLNDESYTPRVISIGPVHYGNKKFQSMENYKGKYLNDFLRRSKCSLEYLVGFVENCEQRIRECYAEKYTEYNSDEFVNMILCDAAFIIEHLFRNRFPPLRTEEDEIVLKPWLTSMIKQDFLLLENQLPFFIIELLSHLSFVPNGFARSFLEVIMEFFELFNTEDNIIYHNITHFVDLRRQFDVGTFDDQRLRPFCIAIDREKTVHGKDRYVEEMYCASQLAEAGLMFKKRSESRCLIDIKFQYGVLEIPGFQLDKETELYARNVKAFEQLHYPKEKAYITDYFRFLDLLIDTDKDVGLLRRKKILVNRLGADCANIVNNLCSTDVADTPSTAYYYQLREDIGRFYDNPWNSFKIKLRRDLSTPWVIVTTIGAILLLLLTLVQTVCTVIQTVK